MSSLDSVTEAVTTYKSLQGKIRKMQHENFGKSLSEKLVAATRDFIEGRSSMELSTAAIDALMEGLNLLQRCEGSMSAASDLSKWAGKQTKDLHKQDLIHFIKRSSADSVSPEHLDFEALKTILEKAAKQKHTCDEEAQQLTIAWLTKALNGIAHKARPTRCC